MATTASERERIVNQAKADLAQRLDLDTDQIEVQEVEAVDFRDASLGLPKLGEVYAQALTPSFKISLAAEGEVYLYHASQNRLVLASFP